MIICFTVYLHIIANINVLKKLMLKKTDKKLKVIKNDSEISKIQAVDKNDTDRRELAVYGVQPTHAGIQNVHEFRQEQELEEHSKYIC